MIAPAPRSTPKPLRQLGRARGETLLHQLCDSNLEAVHDALLIRPTEDHPQPSTRPSPHSASVKSVNNSGANPSKAVLYDLLHAAEDAQLHNLQRPGDETLPPYDRQMLELIVLPVARVLRLIGHDPATADDNPTPAAGWSRTSRFLGVTLERVVDAGLLGVGTQLVSSNGAWPATARVAERGQIDDDGTLFATPSAAASAVKNGPANGWDFWAVESDTGRTTLATLRAKLLADERSESNPPGTE